MTRKMVDVLLSPDPNSKVLVTKPRRDKNNNLCEPLCLCVFPDCIRDRSGVIFIATKAHEMTRKMVDVLLSPDPNSNVLVTKPRRDKNNNLCEPLCLSGVIFFATKAHEITRKFLLSLKQTKDHEDKKKNI